MKIYTKCKMLITGLPMMNNFVIDEYKMELSEIDLSWYDIKNEDLYLLTGSDIYRYAFQANENDDISYSTCFSSISEKIWDVDENLYKDKFSLQKMLLDEYYSTAKSINVKLELITGLSISIHTFIVNVYNEQHEFILRTSGDCRKMNEYRIHGFTDETKQEVAYQINTKAKYITGFESHRKTNHQFDRAISLYEAALKQADVNVRFILLISSLEALFNTHEIDQKRISDIQKHIGKNTSRILFLKNSKSRDHMRNLIIEKYYDYRSRYIHGDANTGITEECTSDLQKIVQNSLVLYWIASYKYQINNTVDMLHFLDSPDKDDARKTEMKRIAAHLRNEKAE